MSEPELFAPKPFPAEGQLSSKPYTQLDRNVVSMLAPHKHQGTFFLFFWMTRGYPPRPPSPLLQDILNHILNDIEIVMGQIGAALAKKASKKKKKKKKKGGNSKEIKAWNFLFNMAIDTALCLFTSS